jgi:hypothetical protein
MGKNHDSKYIENFGIQNPLKNSCLVSIFSQHIIIESFIQLKIYMKVHEVHIHC